MLPDLHQKTEIFQIRSAETTSYQNSAVYGAAGEEKSNFSDDIKSEVKHVTVFCFAFCSVLSFSCYLKLRCLIGQAHIQNKEAEEQNTDNGGDDRKNTHKIVE